MSQRRDGRAAALAGARVEWRSERRWAERPTALWLDGERVAVAVGDHWVEGAAVAGGETFHCFVASDRAGRSFRISQGSRGTTVVERLAGGAAADAAPGASS
jgi:hypothetical protein